MVVRAVFIKGGNLFIAFSRKILLIVYNYKIYKGTHIKIVN
jgi:hypothetical protein